VIYIFWILAAPTAAVSALLILMSVAGQRLSAATPVWLTLAAALGVMGLLAWAHQLATKRGRSGVACAIVVLSWIGFACTMFANGLSQQQTWQ
jgi:small neutral amino acid transporter SnatA (MarC family)